MENQAPKPNGEELAKASEIDFIDFLGLPDCVSVRQDQLEHVLLVHAFYNPPIPEKCPTCDGGWEPKPKRKFLDPFGDIPRGNNPVVVVLVALGYVCKECKKYLDFEIPWCHASRHMTFRLEDYILERAATLVTFDQIALDTFQDRSTVKDIFMEAFLALESERGKALPRVLGIDEVFVHRKYYTILVDVETGNAVDLLPGLRHEIIKPRFEQAGNKEKVEYVLQDFSLTFRSATTQSPALASKKGRRKSSPISQAEHPESENLIPLLFPDLPEPEVEDPAEVEEAIQLSRKALGAMLPNAKAVGDHFHFKKAIEDGFDKIRVLLEKTLPRFYFNRLMKHYRPEEIILQGKKNVKAKVKAEAAKLAKKRMDELAQHKKILSKRPGKLERYEWDWLKPILDDHPKLAKAWNAKNRGLDIFPEKPPLGRTKRAREAAKIKRAGLLISEPEASQKLDDWVASIVKDKELRECFKSPLSMIANWREEIIRIGTTGYSNACTESKNRFLRMFIAISRGLGFEVLRARLIWADEHRRTNRLPSFCDGIEGTITMKRFVELAKAHIARE
jgi:transposase